MKVVWAGDILNKKNPSKVYKEFIGDSFKELVLPSRFGPQLFLVPVNSGELLESKLLYFLATNIKLGAIIPSSVVKENYIKGSHLVNYKPYKDLELFWLKKKDI